MVKCAEPHPHTHTCWLPHLIWPGGVLRKDTYTAEWLMITQPASSGTPPLRSLTLTFTREFPKVIRGSRLIGSLTQPFMAVEYLLTYLVHMQTVGISHSLKPSQVVYA
jgi:hypothetical protein